jgi:hypothetical protein
MSSQLTNGTSSIPTAASKWSKSALDLLNAEYDRLMVTDFQFDELMLPDDIQNSMFRFIESSKS